MYGALTSSIASRLKSMPALTLKNANDFSLFEQKLSAKLRRVLVDLLLVFCYNRDVHNAKGVK